MLRLAGLRSECVVDVDEEMAEGHEHLDGENDEAKIVILLHS